MMIHLGFSFSVQEVFLCVSVKNDGRDSQETGNFFKKSAIMSYAHGKMMSWRFGKPFFHVIIRALVKFYRSLCISNGHNRTVRSFCLL